jgi:hypothetical protein
VLVLCAPITVYEMYRQRTGRDLIGLITSSTKAGEWDGDVAPPHSHVTQGHRSGNPSRSISRSIWCEPRIVPPNVFTVLPLALVWDRGEQGTPDDLHDARIVSTDLYCTVSGLFSFTGHLFA